jgi:hypothetical protein
MPVLFNNRKMEPQMQALKQLLDQVPVLFKTVVETRSQIGDLTASALNEMNTFAISSQAAMTKLDALLTRIPPIPAKENAGADVERNATNGNDDRNN